MSTPETIKAQLRLLLNNANEVTQAEDTTLTEANESLIAGYGQSGGGSSSQAVLRELTVQENGVYEPDSTCDGFCKVIVDVPNREAKLQDKTVTKNGTYTADSGYDGLGSVTVEVESSGGSGMLFSAKAARTHILTANNQGTCYFVPPNMNSSFGNVE